MQPPHPHPLRNREDRSSAPKEHLDLSHTSLSVITVAIPRFAHLRTLRLDHNALEVPPWKELMKIETLAEVDLSHNNIRDLPDYIAGWNTVKRIDLSFNRIERIEPLMWPLFHQVDKSWHRKREEGAFKGATEGRGGKIARVTVLDFRYYPHSCYVELTGATESYWFFGLREPRIVLQGNDALAKSQPYLLEDGDEWKKVVKEWKDKLDLRQYEFDSPNPQAEPEHISRGARVDLEESRRRQEAEAVRTQRRQDRQRSRGKGGERMQKRSDLP